MFKRSGIFLYSFFIGCFCIQTLEASLNRQFDQFEIACTRGWSGSKSEIEELKIETRLEYFKLCRCAQKQGQHCDPEALELAWQRQFTTQIYSQLPKFTKAEKYQTCTQYFVLNRLYLLAFFTRDACETSHFPFASQWIQPSNDLQRESIIGMDKNACFIVESGEKESGLKTVCDPNFVRSYRLKDPSLRNSGIQSPTLNFILNGIISEETPFAMANCHGTASSYAGNFLSDFPVSTLKSWSSSTDPRCMDFAKEKYSSVSNPRVSFLNPSQGISINMKHEACSADDCGSAQWIINGCANAQLDSYVFLDGMCVECWKKMLRQAGFQELNVLSGPKSLQKGCLLTQADHSITILNQSQGFCDYFESTSPAGPPLIRVAPCVELWARFKTRFCPVGKERPFQTP